MTGTGVIPGSVFQYPASTGLDSAGKLRNTRTCPAVITLGVPAENSTVLMEDASLQAMYLEANPRTDYRGFLHADANP